MFFTTASLLLLLHWAEKGFQLRYLLLAGLCCGLAAGTKYNGLISIFVLTLFVPIIYQRSAGKDQQSNGKALLYGLVFAVATFVAFSPWLIRNYVWTGNPIYPLHNSLFQKNQQPTLTDSQSTADETPSALQQITSKGSGAFASRKILYHETWWQALLLPVRFFFEGQDDNPQFFDGKLTPFLLLLPLLTFFFKSPSIQENRETKLLLSFAILYFFLTFFQEAMRVRYIAPIVPPLVILSMYGLHGLNTYLSGRTKGKESPKAVACLSQSAFPASCSGIMPYISGHNLHWSTPSRLFRGMSAVTNTSPPIAQSFPRFSTPTRIFHQNPKCCAFFSGTEAITWILNLFSSSLSVRPDYFRNFSRQTIKKWMY